MHELGVTQEIVDHVAARAGADRVTRVVVRIGRLTALEPDAVRFCFDLCAEGTVVQGAKLEIIETPAIARCDRCGRRQSAEPGEACDCGNWRLEWLSGDELVIQEMELV